jgi:RNase adaptor protein for sRNA GlmZ degradation
VLRRRGSGTDVPCVTGMPGARWLPSLKILEEVGYKALGNLPLSHLPLSHITALIDNTAANTPAIAVGADSSIRGFIIESTLKTLDTITGGRARLFVDCDDMRLEWHCEETRHLDHLVGDRPIKDRIRLKSQAISSLHDRADLIIGTAPLTAADLKCLVMGHFAP